MRTLLALSLAFVLILTTLQADAVNEETERIRTEKRQLLSETAFGRKGNAGGGGDAKGLVPNKGSANTNTANSGSSQEGTMQNKNDSNNEDDDDTNESFHNYRNGSGSSTETHHYFVDDRRPPVHG